MDVVPGEDLLDFIESLNEKKDTQVLSQEEETADSWQVIATALESWTQRILDTKSCRATSKNISTNNRRIVKETTTRWIFNILRYCRVAIYRRFMAQHLAILWVAYLSNVK